MATKEEHGRKLLALVSGDLNPNIAEGIIQTYTTQLRAGIEYRQYHRIDRIRQFIQLLIHERTNQSMNSIELFTFEIADYIARVSVVGSSIDLTNARTSLDEDTSLKVLFTPKPLIHIIQGFPSPHVLQTLGARYQVSLDALLGHLDFPSQLSSLRLHQSLPSEVKQILSIRLVSLACSPSCLHTEFHSAAENQARIDKEMSHFNRGLYQSVTSGRAQYRKCTIHGPWHFSVEQQVSFLATEVDHDAGTWSGVLLSDCGVSPHHAPWDIFGGQSGMHSSFYMINERRYFPHSAFQQRSNITSTGPELTRPQPFDARARRKRLMDEATQRLCCQDPFFFVSDILATAAMSWSQILYFLGEPDETPVHHDDAENQVDQLQRNKHFVDKAIKHFEDILDFMKYRHMLNWPVCKDHHDRDAVHQSTVNLEVDFRFLTAQAKRISEEHSTSISSLMSAISIRESQRAIRQGERVQQLTFLALLFVPASFAATLFSTNIRELQSPSIWQFILTVLVVSTTTITALFRSEVTSLYRSVRMALF